MSAPLPFAVARDIGNNLASGMRQARDENAIEKILSDAMGTGDPTVVQNSIGRILSQVSPERQGPALQYLQNTFQSIQKKHDQAAQHKREQDAGLVPGINPQAQAAIYKEQQKRNRLAQYGLNGDPNAPLNQPTAVDGTSPYLSGTEGEPQSQPKQVPQSVFKRLTKDQLITATGHPDREVSEPAKAELKLRENDEKLIRADNRELRKETLPLKQELITRANLSRESIRNKSHLIDLIDTGNINDPTFAIFAESLPYNLGKRMLSNETVEYKGGLVDEFADLKNIFKGATRVKEVEIYENKLADLYLNDSQKKAILKSRINTAKIDLIREQAAQKVEEDFPNITALQFSRKVDEIAKPQIDALFNTIWDEQKAIFDQAESRKDIPLDFNDPEDKQIISQIYKEAGGNAKAAEKLAKKKGYKF